MQISLFSFKQFSTNNIFYIVIFRNYLDHQIAFVPNMNILFTYAPRFENSYYCCTKDRGDADIISIFLEHDSQRIIYVFISGDYEKRMLLQETTLKKAFY